MPEYATKPILLPVVFNMKSTNSLSKHLATLILFVSGSYKLGSVQVLVTPVILSLSTLQFILPEMSVMSIISAFPSPSTVKNVIFSKPTLIGTVF